MLRFVGCDVHKRTAVFTILLPDGKLLATYTIPVTRESLTAFAERQLRSEDSLAMEATTNTWAVTGLLRPFVREIVIGNPLKVRAIAKPRSKPTRWIRGCWQNCCDATICRGCGSRTRKHSDCDG